MPNQPILILGAGIGGLSAAIHLAASGHKVTVLEQNPAVGGKMSEIHGGRFPLRYRPLGYHHAPGF
jgi:phytoene dehydrogenase-like protein